MTYSIFHFFASLIQQRHLLKKPGRLDDFPFDTGLLSCVNAGQFPDLAIKLTKGNSLFSGGELIELKDSKSYSVSSFNSTIPVGRKAIAKVIKGKSGKIRAQMEAAGDEIESLPIRDVFYLVRGRNQTKVKVALVHGSFFETLPIGELIKNSFAQVLEERCRAIGMSEADIEKLKALPANLFSEQESFSKVRNVEKAAVKLRFRVMTEVKAEGNILNTAKYPAILDDTLNLVVPCHSNEEERLAVEKMSLAGGKERLSTLRVIKLKHHFNGFFLVFQLPL